MYEYVYVHVCMRLCDCAFVCLFGCSCFFEMCECVSECAWVYLDVVFIAIVGLLVVIYEWGLIIFLLGGCARAVFVKMY